MHTDKNKADTAQLEAQGRLEPHVRGYLGARLRAEYQTLHEEPVPVEHIDLLLALRHKERERKRRV